MFWYLQKEEERPFSLARKFQQGPCGKDVQDFLNREGPKWKAAQGRYVYHPNAKEYKFFLQPHWVKAISGGNRSGKTATCVIDLVMQIEGWHPLQKKNLEILVKDATEEWVRKWCQKMLDEKRWIHDPPIHARCVAVDYPNYVEKIIGPEYEKWATLNMLKEINYDNDKKRKITWKDGSFVEFMTQEQKLKAHGGAKRHVIQVDEELAQDYWVENTMRVISVDGRMVYGATAVEGITWTEDKIFVPGERGDEDIYMIEMSTYDNPVNTDKVIDKILKQCMDETDVDIRIHGKRKRRGGNVYKMAKDELPWIIPRFEIPRNKGLLLLAIDVHPQIEHALLWMWADYDGIKHELMDGLPNIYEIGEVFEHGSPQEIKYFIDMTETKLGRKHDHVLCDPSAWNTDQAKPEDKSLADQFSEMGVYVQKGSKDRYANNIRIGQLLTLHHPKMPISELARTKGNPDMVLKLYPDARPRLFTFEDLGRTRFERRNWHFPVYKGPAAQEHDKIKPKPVDKDDHMMENEGRMGAYIEDFNPQELVQLPSEDEKTYVNDKGERIDVKFDEDDDVQYDFDDAILG